MINIHLSYLFQPTMPANKGSDPSEMRAKNKSLTSLTEESEEFLPYLHSPALRSGVPPSSLPHYRSTATARRNERLGVSAYIFAFPITHSSLCPPQPYPAQTSDGRPYDDINASIHTRSTSSPVQVQMNVCGAGSGQTSSFARRASGEEPVLTDLCTRARSSSSSSSSSIRESR